MLALKRESTYCACGCASPTTHSSCLPSSEKTPVVIYFTITSLRRIITLNKKTKAVLLCNYLVIVFIFAVGHIRSKDIILQSKNISMSIFFTKTGQDCPRACCN